MTPIEQQARDSLYKLVQYVFDHREGLIQGVPYETLAAWIARVNRHGIGHGRGMGAVLSRMGRMLQEIDDEWGEEMPQLSSLVVRKSGPNQGLPDEGIQEFWPDYPKMSYAEKMNRVRIEHDRVVNFGSRWNDVLEQLGLPRVEAQSRQKPIPRVFASGGE